MSVYKQMKNDELRNKVDDMLIGLPSFCRVYVNGREGVVSPRTMYLYIERISMFFSYLRYSNSYFNNVDFSKSSLSILENFNVHDFEDFAHWLRSGKASDGRMKSEKTVNNYLSAISSLYEYFVRIGDLKSNPVSLMERKKIRKSRHVVHLDAESEEGFLNAVKNGQGLTDVQHRYYGKMSVRDTAICMILLRTGIRVSELVGLNIDDVDMKKHSLQILRKRDKADIVYFDDMTSDVLSLYLDERSLYNPDKKEKALFLVSIGKYKGRRLSVRSVELLVKKYAVAGAPMVGNKITPHKLRATFALDMLEATGGDLHLVQQALDHERPETTVIYLDSRQKQLEQSRNLIHDFKKGLG